nr:hypothetical protein BdHM001_33110 [Bdellovibrio sp. HM001]
MFKKTKFIIALGMFVGSVSQAQHVGFEKGNSLTVTPIQGQVRVMCGGFNGSGSAVYTCRDLVMSPNAYDYFVGPRDGRATKVELTAVHQDGSGRRKTESYSGSRGRSEDAFNLWISTLFQKPLLENGTNKISYRLLGSNAVYAEGTFTAVVNKSVPKECPATTYQSTDINDCSSQYSVCQRYFREFNNCQ